jgi:hypothetical protein
MYVQAELRVVICIAHQTGLLQKQIVKHLLQHGVSVEEATSLLGEIEQLLSPSHILSTYEEARTILLTESREPRDAITGLQCYDGVQCAEDNRCFLNQKSFGKHNRSLHSDHHSSCTPVKVQRLFNKKHHIFYFSVTPISMPHP